MRPGKVHTLRKVYLPVTTPNRPSDPDEDDGQSTLPGEYSCDQLGKYFTMNVPTAVTVREGLGDNYGHDSFAVIPRFVVASGFRGYSVFVKVTQAPMG
jgi:hypothetical protein